MALSVGVADGVPFMKGTTTLAHLYTPSKLGTFTAFERMEVTKAGRAAGYTNLEFSQLVVTPHAKTIRGNSTQLPVRNGMLYRLVLGFEKAGQIKLNSEQQRLLCLSLVDKVSAYSDGVTDAEGRCFAHLDGHALFNHEVEERHVDLFDASEGLAGTEIVPLSMDDFVWVFSSALHTRGCDWCCPDSMKRGRIVSTPATKPNPKLPRNGAVEVAHLCTDLFPSWIKLADTSIKDLAIPSVTTAVGQAKRATPPRRLKRDHSESEESDEYSGSDE